MREKDELAEQLKEEKKRSKIVLDKLETDLRG
jgi:hypothetical protein